MASGATRLTWLTWQPYYNAPPVIPLAARNGVSYLRAVTLVITLLVVGGLLLLLETVLPGMIAGIAGAICIVVGVAEAYHQFDTSTGNMVLLGTVIGLLFGAVLWVRYFPHSRAGQMFVSKGVSGDTGVGRAELVGQSGTALTALRPSGTAGIGGQRVDVVTEGDMIERDTPVKVVAVEGLRVVVRAI